MKCRVFLAVAVALGAGAGCAVRTARGASSADMLELLPYPQEVKLKGGGLLLGPADCQEDRKPASLPPLPDGVRLIPDLEYAHPHGHPLLLDLYVPPPGDKPAPIILWVHGGGRDMGDRHDRTAVPLTAYGYAVASIEEKAVQASPITFVSKDDPPFLIMHGDRDPMMPLAQSEILRDALEKAGVEVRLQVVRGAGHGFDGPQIMDTVRQFFDEHLKRRGASQRKSARAHASSTAMTAIVTRMAPIVNRLWATR
ncbi:MAG: alpha/beta hydrolase [Isosphaerales bacterium]